MTPHRHVRTPLRLGAVFALLAVAAGAFGAHALKTRLPAEDLAIFEVAVRYQMYHALALLGCAALSAAGYRTRPAEIAFVAGTLVFSGSLYALVLLDVRWLGAITPIGGVALLVGWLALCFAGARSDERAPPIRSEA